MSLDDSEVYKDRPSWWPSVSLKAQQRDYDLFEADRADGLVVHFSGGSKCHPR